MKKEIVSAPAAGAPVGPYSQAVKVGDWIFVSGEKGVDPTTGQIVEGGIRTQTAQALRNVEAILKTAGSSLADVVRCVVYMSDTDDFAAMNEAYAEFFPKDPPARSTVIVASLPLNLQVLIEVTAIQCIGTR
jgi:2-iminobutanoate/2-iminopropanoate deaminase